MDICDCFHNFAFCIFCFFWIFIRKRIDGLHHNGPVAATIKGHESYESYCIHCQGQLLKKSLLKIVGHFDPELVPGQREHLQENYANSVFNKKAF